MKYETLIAIKSVAAADPTSTPEDLERLFAACKGNTRKSRRTGTVREAARILNCHPRTVQRYERQGLLNAIRITKRRIRYDLDEVERLAFEGVGS